MTYSPTAIFSSLLLLVLLFSTCKSLEELYDAGEYHKAFQAAIKQLDQKPADQEALQVLEKSLAALITDRQEEFVSFSSSQEFKDWEKSLDVIAEMDELLEQAAVHLPAPFADEQAQWWAEALVIEEQLYYHYLESGKKRLAESKSQNNAALAQKAYYDFDRAIHYQRPAFTEVGTLSSYLAEAKQVGTIYYKVAINEGFNVGLGVDIDGAFEHIEETNNPFLNVEIVFIANDGDCAIDIDFGEFETEISERSSTENYQEEILVRHDTEFDTAGVAIAVPVYEEVHGTLTTFTNRKVARWEVKVDVSSRTSNCTIFSERYQREITSTYEYTKTDGDSRAIPIHAASIGRGAHPSDDDMAEELLYDLVDLIYDDYFAEW